MIEKILKINNFQDDGIIKLEDNTYIRIIKIDPINYEFISESDKNNILDNFKNFLVNFDEDIQIFIKNEKEDLNKNINYILSKNNKNLFNKKYTDFLNKLNNKNKFINKNFYIVIKNKKIDNLNEKYFLLKEKIKIIGNKYFELNKDEIKKLFNFDYIKIENNKINYLNLKNPKYLEINGLFFSGLIIFDYLREYSDLILKKILDINENIMISIFFEKTDETKVLNQLSNNIGNIGVDLEKFNNSRQDIDIAKFSYSEGLYIRKEIQINNQKLFYFNIYINIYDFEKKSLDKIVKKIEWVIRSAGMKSKRSYFRQLQLFNSTFPILYNDKDVSKSSKRNILSDGVKGLYPFISSKISEEKGILYVLNLKNDSLILVNTFDREKYKNSNMCIFGSSGAGKSFFTKLMIFRNYLIDNQQFIIDPEREYGKLAESLKGSIIKIGPKSNNYINIFDIRKDSLEDDSKGFLATKIEKLLNFFKLIFYDFTAEEFLKLEESIIKIYEEKGINFDDKTLYIDKKFKKSKDMPIMEDLYKIVNEKIRIRLNPFVNGHLSYFNKYTNVELDNKLIIADIYDMGEENLKYGMFLFTEIFWDNIKEDRKKQKIIYFDEIWRLIGVTANRETASFIYKIFKTIRKYGGSGVAITQDISDLFSLDMGSYGKSLLNNSEIKIFFYLEEENLKILEKNVSITNEEKKQINFLKKGECILFIGKEHVLSKVVSDDYEREIIE